jgi:hypothetical protein
LQQKHILWEKYADSLLINGKLELPGSKKLFQMAGYSDYSRKIKIFESSLFLKNVLGYSMLDAYYYIFTSLSSNGKSDIKKIMVIIYNNDDNSVTNLLAYAPMLCYSRYPEVRSGRSELDGYATYIPKEYLHAEVKDEYMVYPHKAGYYVFDYDKEYRDNGLRFVGNQRFDDVCEMVLEGVDDLYGQGKAQLRVGEGGKFHLEEIKQIYP